jgi:hypothetical protein
MKTRVAASLIAIVLLRLTAAAQSPVNQARVADAHGTVEKKLNPTDARWQKVSVGDVLSPAASIRTGANSAVLLALHDRHNLRIGEQTELQLKELGQNRSYLFDLIRGEIWSFVNKARQPAKYEVETPSTVLGVTGTLFSVEHNTKTDESETTVAAGSVSVGRGASAQSVAMGFQTKVRKGQNAPAQVRPLDPHMRMMWQHMRQNESWTTAAGDKKIDPQTEARVQELKDQRAQQQEQLQKLQQQRQQQKKGAAKAKASEKKP